MKVKRIVDCSQSLYHNAPVWPDRTIPQTEIHRSHYLARDGFNLEFVKMITHAGTHIDTPWHMINYGKKLDDYPLSSFISEGPVIDASGKPPQGDITLEDLKPYEKDINKGEIVVIYTGWGEKRGYESLYLKDWPALTPEAAKWLIEKKINAIGIDTLSFDKFGAKGAPVHNVLLPAGVLLIEEMYLPKEILERRKWWFIFLPLYFKGVAGSPCRAVAIEWEE